MPRQINWNGTGDEALTLLHALRAHCACRVDQGRTVVPCAGHHMLATDQRAVDGLLFMRRMAARLLTEEFCIGLPHKTVRVPTYPTPEASTTASL